MMAHSLAATLATERLRLLPAHEDLALLVLAFHEANAEHLSPWRPPFPPDFATDSFQRERLRRAAAEADSGTSAHWWLQQREDSRTVVGNVALTQIARGPFQSAMLGYSIDARCEGLGLMREALQAVITHAFSPAVNLHRIQANVRPENIRSVVLLQRLGFEDEGLAREYLFINGAWRDHRMFALRNGAFAGVPS